jgi:hypothetical protein
MGDRRSLRRHDRRRAAQAAADPRESVSEEEPAVDDLGPLRANDPGERDNASWVPPVAPPEYDRIEPQRTGIGLEGAKPVYAAEERLEPTTVERR